jgi:hypothetical protein
VANLPPVSLIPVANLPPVSLTPVVHLDLRNFEKIRNDPTVIIRGLGDGDAWKKPEAKNLVTFCKNQTESPGPKMNAELQFCDTIIKDVDEV